MNRHDKKQGLFHCLNESAMQTFQWSDQLYYSLSESELEALLQQSLGFLDDSKVLKDIGLFPIPEDVEEPLQNNVDAFLVLEKRNTQTRGSINMVGVVGNAANKSA